MLPADNNSYVAAKLIESKFLNDTLQPSHLLSQLEALNAYSVKRLTRKRLTYNTGVIVYKTSIDKL